MSREIRRVPVGWQHPVEHNPHWYFQANTLFGRGRPASRLHGPTERFVGLCDGYLDSVARWEQEGRDLAARTGWSWEFAVRWHLTGYDDCTCHPGEAGVLHQVYGWSEDGQTEILLPIVTEDELHAHKTTEHESERPDPKDYMPVFDAPVDELGWCLYETVSEGCPVTPVFATAEELVDHLATVGQDWDQVPLRRESAEALVSAGWMPSMMSVGGRLLQGAEDADKIAAL